MARGLVDNRIQNLRFLSLLALHGQNQTLTNPCLIAKWQDRFGFFIDNFSNNDPGNRRSSVGSGASERLFPGMLVPNRLISGTQFLVHLIWPAHYPNLHRYLSC